MLWGSAFTGSPAECLELPEGPVALLGILKHAADSTVGKKLFVDHFHRFKSL